MLQIPLCVAGGPQNRTEPKYAGHFARNDVVAGRMDRQYFVYIMSSRSRNLYTGVTNNLIRRTAQPKFSEIPGFSSKYRAHRLVYVERYGDVRCAISREKQIKSWRREKKIALIEGMNPTWGDLAESWFPKTPEDNIARLPRKP